MTALEAPTMPGGCVARVFITPEDSQTPLETEHALRAANYAELLFQMVNHQWSWDDKLTNAWALETWLCHIGQKYFPNKLVGTPLISTDEEGVTSGIYRVTDSGRAVRVSINSRASDGSIADNANVQSGRLELSGVSITQVAIESHTAIGRMNYIKLYGDIIDAITGTQKLHDYAADTPTPGQIPVFDFDSPKD